MIVVFADDELFGLSEPLDRLLVPFNLRAFTRFASRKLIQQRVKNAPCTPSYRGRNAGEINSKSHCSNPRVA